MTVSFARSPCTGERRGNDQQCDHLLYRFSHDSFLGAVLKKAPSIGIQATQRSNWYSKQVDQKIIYQQKQMGTDRFQITPAPPPASCTLSNVHPDRSSTALPSTLQPASKSRSKPYLLNEYSAYSSSLCRSTKISALSPFLSLFPKVITIHLLHLINLLNTNPQIILNHQPRQLDAINQHHLDIQPKRGLPSPYRKF